ncbi:MAG: pitrilysin family protein [Myxococcota bacterium]
MRQWILAGCTAVWLALPAPARAFPYEVHTRTLENGCELVVVPMPSEGVVATAVWMDVGSRNEVEPGRTGYAHFFEHLLFSGTETLDRAGRDAALLKLGIGDNAWTWLDETVYTGTSDTESLDAWMGIQADMMAHLALTPDHVKRESGAVYGEYRKTQASPDFHLDQALRRTAFTVHPYAHDTLGYEADIAAMPGAYDYVQAFYERWYQPGNARVLLVGDVTPEAGFALLEKHFGPWAPKPVAVLPEIPEEPAQTGPRSVEVAWDSEIPPQLMFGWRIPAANPSDPEVAALSLAEALLLGRAGRLPNRLVREEALALSVSGGLEPTVDPGLFLVHIELKDAADRARVEAIVQEEIEGLVKGVDPAFFARTRSNARYRGLLELDDPENVLYVVGDRMRRGARAADIGAFDEAVAAVDPGALGAAVAKHLTPEHRTIAWIAHGAPAEPETPAPAETPGGASDAR